MLEHLIMRKQNQIDFRLRARRTSTVGASTKCFVFRASKRSLCLFESNLISRFTRMVSAIESTIDQTSSRS